jgi:hypothetical protein
MLTTTPSLCTLSAEACYVRNIATVGAPPASTPASPGYPLPPVSPSFSLAQVAVGASSSRSGSRSPVALAAAQRPALAAKRALFSSRGALLAVALEDDSVLVARVEHFTSGARAGEELRVSVCCIVHAL